MPSRIPDEKIAEWKALVGKASPGPWRRGRGYDEAVTLPDGAKEWEEGWVYSADGREVMAYAGCGSHNVEWANPTDGDVMIAAGEALPLLLAEREEMLALLREVEWAGCVTYDDGSGVLEVTEGGCPHCKRGLQGNTVPAAGHAPDGRLAAFLGKGE